MEQLKGLKRMAKRVVLPLSIRNSTKTFDCNTAPRRTIRAAENSVHPADPDSAESDSPSSMPNKNGGRTINRTPAKNYSVLQGVP